MEGGTEKGHFLSEGEAIRIPSTGGLSILMRRDLPAFFCFKTGGHAGILPGQALSC